MTGQHSLTFPFGIDIATNTFLLFPANFAATITVSNPDLDLPPVVGVVDTTDTNGTANLTANITGSLLLRSAGGLYLRDLIADAHYLNDAASFTGAARFGTQLQGDRPAHEPEVR